MTMLLRLRDGLSYVFHLLFRHYDFPCECGLRRIGRPDEQAPVFLSGNYVYTVAWLEKVLRGRDCWLLVADSSGSNVWCAAGMNEFSEHDVIDAVNVAELSRVVTHRRIVAPPFAAPGIDVDAVERETGFRVVWGPAHLRDLPRYIDGGLRRTSDMRSVQFRFRDRIEPGMSCAMAYFLTCLLGLVFVPRYIPTFALFFFGVHFVSFAGWPLLPSERRFRRTGLLWAVLSAALVAWSQAAGWSAAALLGHWALLTGVVAFVAMDHAGSTSLHKTTVLHWLRTGNYDSHFGPVVDPEACSNCARCVSVCPKDVLARLERAKRVVAVRPQACMECLACVKQCTARAILDRNWASNQGRLKGDVKSIPELAAIVGRDPGRLAREARWIGAATHVHGEFRYVDRDVEERLSGPVARGEAATA